VHNLTVITNSAASKINSIYHTPKHLSHNHENTLKLIKSITDMLDCITVAY